MYPFTIIAVIVSSGTSDRCVLHQRAQLPTTERRLSLESPSKRDAAALTSKNDGPRPLRAEANPYFPP
jgi:hypothetical protein